LGTARKAASLALKFELEVNSLKWKTRAESGFWRTPKVDELMRQFSVCKPIRNCEGFRSEV
jgi:hypothetical protein